MLFGQLYVGQLWMCENLRNQGYGTKLMNLVEDYAKNNGARFISVNTMNLRH
ncbi:MAG: GNAT family N-acetyltransferase [Gammaproteobacteria bacterium]|nr:GNAT family N-acetyltransferase [Gammaproteobacteria bacterium]